MPANKNVLAFVMAGGEGSRLHPLTANRCKPAVPFNGKHRIVDFVLSNLVNSEIYATYLLVQYKSQSLIEHVRQSWTMARFIPQHFITVVPPSMVETHKLVAYDFASNTIPGTESYEEHADWRDVGTIDAFYQAHFDTLGAQPRFRMTNRPWPIYASPDQAESAQIVGASTRMEVLA